MKALLPSFVFTAVVFIAALTGCKKDPIYVDIHKDTTIIGNQAPHYDEVTNLQVRLYVNKIYVDLVGHEPTSAELDTKANFLLQNNLDSTSRDQIVKDLLTTSGYYQRLFEISSSQMLNSADSLAILGELYLLHYIRDTLGGAGAPLFFYDFEINRLDKLASISKDLKNGTIDIREYYRRMIDNYFYDQVNMGSENFVKGVFNDLLGREPTDGELDFGVSMVDGQPAILFLQNGGSKSDFQNILVNTPEFMEGLVRKTYLQLLLRVPGSEEMAAGTKELSQTMNLPAFQKKLIISKDYAGF